MKTKTETHTPTPWEVRNGDSPQIVTKGNEYAICTTYGVYSTKEEKAANAAFIVRAVNAYESLLKENIELRIQKEKLLETLIMALPYVEMTLEEGRHKPGVVERMVKQIRDAIKESEGGN